MDAPTNTVHLPTPLSEAKSKVASCVLSPSSATNTAVNTVSNTFISIVSNLKFFVQKPNSEQNRHGFAIGSSAGWATNEGSYSRLLIQLGESSVIGSLPLAISRPLPTS